MMLGTGYERCENCKGRSCLKRHQFKAEKLTMVVLRLCNRSTMVMMMDRILVVGKPVNGCRRCGAEKQQDSQPDGADRMEDASQHGKKGRQK